MKCVVVTVVAAVVAWLGLFPNPGESLICYVCLPSFVGSQKDKDLAAKWRAEIARAWTNATISDFGLCEEMTYYEEFIRTCDHGPLSTACINVTTGSWVARTCGKMTTNMGWGCRKQDGSNICYSLQDYGNNAASGHTSTLVLTLLLTLVLFL